MHNSVASRQGAVSPAIDRPVQISSQWNSKRRFCVVIHDVTPHFAREIDRILAMLEPLVGARLGAAVVPFWHGTCPDSNGLETLDGWRLRFGEVLFHGLTHRRELRPGLVSLCTNRADEFGGLAASAICDRLSQARLQIRQCLQSEPVGVVPPAWQFRGRLSDLRPAGVEYVLRFTCCETLSAGRVPVATWSWDWGRLPGLARVGDCLGTFRRWQSPQAIPVVALHPADVARGLLPRAQRLLNTLREAGAKPILPAELARATSGVVSG